MAYTIKYFNYVIKVISFFEKSKCWNKYYKCYYFLSREDETALLVHNFHYWFEKIRPKNDLNSFSIFPSFSICASYIR